MYMYLTVNSFFSVVRLSFADSFNILPRDSIHCWALSLKLLISGWRWRWTNSTDFSRAWSAISCCILQYTCMRSSYSITDGLRCANFSIWISYLIKNKNTHSNVHVKCKILNVHVHNAHLHVHVHVYLSHIPSSLSLFIIIKCTVHVH